jgi:hypothetical protein
MKISQLLDAINDLELVMPEFQREYVWSLEQAKELMVSLFNDYPTGSLLVWETTEPPEIKNDARKTEKAGWFKVLLDGQQRLTTLYLLTRGEIPPYYTEKEITNDPRNLYFNIRTGDFGYYQKQRMETSPYWKPVTECFTDDVDVFQLIESIEFDENDDKLATGKMINQNLNKLRSITSKEYHVESVPQNASIDQAIDVFDRVNSRGTKLTEAELVLTHISGKWSQMRREMKSAIEKYSAEGFDFELDLMTRCMVVMLTESALWEKMTTEMYESLTEEKYKETWVQLEKILDYLIPLLKNSAYLSGTAEMNTKNVLVPIVAYLAHNDGKFPTSTDANHFIHWLFSALLWGRYSGQTNERLNKDVYIAINEENPVKALMQEVVNQRGRTELKPADIDGSGSGTQAHKLLYVLAKYNKATDWSTGGAITATLGAQNKIQSHHIFPKAYLGRNGYDTASSLHKQRINEIANRAYITRDSNFDITDKAPESYLPEINTKYPNALKQQYIPDKPELWEVENYEQFLDMRRQMLTDAINEFINHFIKEDPEPSAPDYLAIIEKGESDFTEFKSSLRWDMRQNEVNKKLEFVIAKTVCSFLNSEGGRLFIGVDDDKNILGLEHDYQTLKKGDSDAFLLQFDQVVNNYLGKENHQFISAQIVNIDGKEVCVITADAASGPVFVNQEEFFIRANASTQPMNMTEANNYIKSHWS